MRSQQRSGLDLIAAEDDCGKAPMRYVAARRAETALAGFAQFDFTAENEDPMVVTDAVAAALAGIHAPRV